MMELSKDKLSEIIKEYIEDSIALLNQERRSYEKRAIEVVTRPRLFGLRAPMAINPTPEEAVRIVKERLKWYGYSRHSYMARRVQATMFQDMIDRGDADSKFLISVDDHSMLMNCDYSSKASWNANRWDAKNDPELADMFN